VRAVSDAVQMELRPKGKRILQRSYLSELLDIANTTGRRLSAICGLRFEDLRLEKTATAPHGAILWPARTDKKRKARLAPLAPRARAAIDRIIQERPGIGTAPLFPSPVDPAQPISRHLADAWLRKAETTAKLSKQKGGLWHPYRRKWATERKHLPDVDVAQAGGWESLDALKKSYQHADAATMLSVVLGGAELRDVKQG
jgi:integrase